MTLKTLKDLKQWFISGKYYMIDKEELKQEAIKWVKEDIQENNNQISTSTSKWMKRLDITEEDLEPSLDDFEDRFNPMSFYAMIKEMGILKEDARRYAEIYELGVYQNIIDLAREHKCL